MSRISFLLLKFEFSALLTSAFIFYYYMPFSYLLEKFDKKLEESADI